MLRGCFVLIAALVCEQGSAVGQSLMKPAAVLQPYATESDQAPASSVTIPAGTNVLMTLKSPLNTVSARAGSGLYFETTFDVIQQNHIVIPAKTLVQGVVESQTRPGRVKGRGHLQFHLTTLILPSNYTASIAGSLQSLPGSNLYEGINREGAIQPVDQIDKDAASIVISVIAGALIGSITHGDFRAGRGAMIGAAFGLGKVLFKRGDDIRLPAGTTVEMVLDRSLTIPLRELELYMRRSETPVMKPTPCAVTPIEAEAKPAASRHAHFAIPKLGIDDSENPSVCLAW
jgi:hypothetical protein